MKKLLQLFLLMTMSFLAFGQTGSLDPNFFISNDGSAKGFNGSISKVLRLSDGKLLCIGNFTKYGSLDAPKIARLNPDGTLDTSFSSPNLGSGIIEGLDLQPDGKIMISGSFTTINTIARAFMGRLNSDGTLDATFNANLQGSGYSVKTVTVLSDGRIAGGGTLLLPGPINRRIAVFSSTGVVDASFDASNSTVLDNQVTSIVEAPNNKLYAVGFFTGGLVRLNSDGTKDTTFDFGTGAGCGSGNACIRAIALTNNGNRVVVVGLFNSFSGDTSKVKIVKLLSNGSIDSTFNVPTNGFNSEVSAVYANEDNSLYVGGAFSKYGSDYLSGVAKLNANGTLDTTFQDPIVSTAYVTGVVPFNNKLIIYGGFYAVNGINAAKLAVLNDNGTRDFSFMLQGSGFDASINKVAKQADGKLVVIGGFNYLDNSQAMNITRMNADGTRDTTFNSGTGFNSVPQNIAIDKNGKIVLVGYFSMYNGVAVKNIVRLNTDGSLDTSFSPGTGANNGINVLDIDSDNKIYIAGLFTSYNGVARNKVARLNTDGSIDTSFVPSGIGTTYGAYAIKLLSDGNILLGGNFSVDGNNILLAKLTSTGALVAQTSFAREIATGATYVSDFDIQADGKIVIVGNFRYAGNYGRTGIARVNANGFIDQSFAAMGTGFVASANPRSVKVLPDGNILIAGLFSVYNGSPRYGIAKVTNTGALWSNNDMVLNSTGGVHHMLYDNGWVYLSGPFTSYNNLSKSYLVKALAYSTAPIAADQTLCPGSKVSDLVAQGENLKWYSALTGGTALASTQTLSTNTDYYVSQTIQNVESTRTKVRVTLQGTPAPTGNAVQYLSAGSTLANLSVTGSNIKWYATEDDALMRTNSIPASTVVVLENTYYATQSIGTCESSMFLEVKVRDISLSVSDINKSKVSIYPNPVKDVLNISTTEKIEKIVIYNAIGVKVLEKSNVKTIDVTKLLKGMYVVSITSEKGTQTKKFIKN